jgi:predicted MFS family arabinose efflux permease
MANPASNAAPARQASFWVIMLSAATVAAVGMGIRQVMGLFLRPVSEDLGIGREAFGFAIAIANIAWGIAAPFTGAVADKFGSGRVVLFGASCTAAGLLMMCLATSEVHLVIAGLFLGLGTAGAGVNAMVGTVARAAPPAIRTAAISWIGMGAGVGVFVALPYTHLLIESLGHKMALVVLAGTAFIMLPLAWAVRGKPVHAVTTVKAQTLKEALVEACRHPSFLLLNAGYFVCGFQLIFYSVHLPAYVADQGLPANVAIISLTCVGVGNLLGTWLAGQSAHYFPRRYTLSFIYLGRAVIFLGFLFLPISGPMVIISSALLGLLWLSTVPLTSSLVGVFFGPVWITMLYGLVFLSHQLGSFAGVWLAGYMYDLTKSYDAMWWICIGLGVFAALVHWPIVESPVARLRQPMVAPAE